MDCTSQIEPLVYAFIERGLPMDLPNKAPSHPTPPPLVRVSGTHREMGHQIGESCRKQVQHSIQSGRTLLAEAYSELGLTWNGAQIQSQKYILFAKECYPQYVEEMTGIAEGANVAFEDVAVINCMEALTEDALRLSRCTSLAVNNDISFNGHVLLAHNEDWVPEDEGGVFVVHATPKNECPFLAMTYGCLLPNVGFNAYGIAQLCDTVYPKDSRIGIPRILISRAVLASVRPEQAIREVLLSKRAAGYNHLLAHESGELYSVEVSARHFAILSGEDGYIVHTNHYLTPEMQKVEREPDNLIASRVRYMRARRLLKHNDQHSIKSLQAILCDHVNFPHSICNHSVNVHDPLDREKTINSIVIDLTAREMHIAWGNPCENPYYIYHLNA
jgi:isopenicillin-N N-acyltransferase-like protein